MRKFSIALFVVGAGQLSFPISGQAQFLKKLFAKPEPAKRHYQAVIEKPVFEANAATTELALPEKKAVNKLFADSKMKDRYRVDVFGSLYLNELVVGDKAVYKSFLPAKTLPGLGFYQGVKLAADTLNRYNYKLDVYFHDITSAGEDPNSLIKKGALDSSDLIIGSVHANLVAPLSAFALKHKINFVSTLSPSDANVSGNPYFSMVQPSLTVHCEALRLPISQKGRFANILVYRRSKNGLDDQCFETITKGKPFIFTEVDVDEMMPSEQLKSFLDSTLSNVVVMPIVDQKYALQLLQQLNSSFPNYRFEVYGMPSWKGMPILQKEGGLANMSITIGSPFYFDPSSSAGKAFADYYSEVYGGRAPEMAYRGYETLYWYAFLLTKYGTLFNDDYRDNGVAPFTRFQFELGKSADGNPTYFENQHVYFYRYQKGEFNVLPE